MNFRKFLLQTVFVVTIPALVFAQTVTLAPQINNPQTNNLDASGNTSEITLDNSVQNDQTQTGASQNQPAAPQNQTSGEQTATYDEDNSVVNPPAEENGEPYVGDQEQATNENEFAYQEQDFAKQEQDFEQDGRNKNKIDDTEDNGACADEGCEQDNYSSNSITMNTDILSYNTAANFQGNALSVSGFYQGGTPEAGDGVYSSANAAGFALSSINTANTLSGVGVVNGNISAGSSGSPNAQVSAMPSATSASTVTATTTFTTTTNINVTDNFSDNFSNNTLNPQPSE